MASPMDVDERVPIYVFSNKMTQAGVCDLRSYPVHQCFAALQGYNKGVMHSTEIANYPLAYTRPAVAGYPVYELWESFPDEIRNLVKLPRVQWDEKQVERFTCERTLEMKNRPQQDLIDYLEDLKNEEFPSPETVVANLLDLEEAIKDLHLEHPNLSSTDEFRHLLFAQVPWFKQFLGKSSYEDLLTALGASTKLVSHLRAVDRQQENKQQDQGQQNLSGLLARTLRWTRKVIGAVHCPISELDIQMGIAIALDKNNFNVADVWELVGALKTRDAAFFQRGTQVLKVTGDGEIDDILLAMLLIARAQIRHEAPPSVVQRLNPAAPPKMIDWMKKLGWTVLFDPDNDNLKELIKTSKMLILN